MAGALAVEVASAVGDVADRGELGGLLGLRVGDEGEHCVNESSVWVVCVFFRLCVIYFRGFCLPLPHKKSNWTFQIFPKLNN